MSDYTKVTDFTAKDSLPSGNANKVVVGAEFDTEFDAIEVAVNSKYDDTDDNVANGIAALDGTGLLSSAVIPTATFTAAGGGEIATAAEATTSTSQTTLLTPWHLNNQAGVLSDLINLTDPGADRLLFWDESADTTGQAGFLTVGTGLAITGTTIASDDAAIDHDALLNFVADEHVAHSSVSITAGAGLTGGGTIAATRTIDVGSEGFANNPVGTSGNNVIFNITSLSDIDVSGIQPDDPIYLYDNSGSHRRLQWRNIGVRIVASATQTLDLNDANSLLWSASGANFTITVPPNSSVAFPVGTQIGFLCQGAGNQTIAAGAGVTIFSLNSNLTVRPNGGGAYLVKVNTDSWSLVGDLE